MCRWFAYISPSEPCLLSDVLVTPQNSISRQVSAHYLPGLVPHEREHVIDREKDGPIWRANSVLNIDGFGLTWFTDTAESFNEDCKGLRPATYKSISPPTTDYNFLSLCQNTESRCCFAHVRATSGTSVAQVNSHPFTFGRHVFMHNGTVTSFASFSREIAQMLTLEEFAHIAGSTDSEHMAALYMHHLTGGRGPTSWEKSYHPLEMADALSATVHDILSVQERVLKRLAPGQPIRPNGLNLAVTDGKSLVAVRFRNHKTEEPPSLYWSNTAGLKLNRKYPGHPDKHVEREAASKKDPEQHGRHVIVSSEPTTYDEKEWHLIEQNQIIIVDGEGSVTFEPCLSYWEMRAADSFVPHGVV